MIPVTVSTLPELAEELLEMSDRLDYDGEDDADEGDDEDSLQVQLRDGLIPDNSFLSLGMVPWELVSQMQKRSQISYQSQGITPKGEGMPVILIQTSRPKAQSLIKKIQDFGGLTAICFNPGEDPLTGNDYDLGILQMGNGDLYLFGEFIADDPEHIQARRNWDSRCHKTKGHCGLIVAMGITGSSRGNPQIRDMMALFEAQAVDSQELAMGVLQLMPQFDF
jgi:hypothetical protein